MGKLPRSQLKVVVLGANPAKVQCLAIGDGCLVMLRMTTAPLEELVGVCRLLEEISMNSSICEGHSSV